MAFLKKFGETNNKGPNPPVGVNLQNSSFAIVNHQGTYAPSFQPTVQQSKPDTNSQHRAGRPGGGWDDDDDVPTLNTGSQGNTPGGYGNYSQSGSNMNFRSSFPSNNPPSFSDNQVQPLHIHKAKESRPEDLELIAVDESFLQGHEYEHKLVLDTIQLGGARLKQADSLLTEFIKASETLNVPVVSSILISKLRTDLNFVSKARALYDIEALVKKLDKYLNFFKHNLPTLKGLNFSLTDSSQTNVKQLQNILDSLIKYITDPQSGLKPTKTFEKYVPTVITTQHQNEGNLIDMDEPVHETHSANVIKSRDRIDLLNSTPNSGGISTKQATAEKPNAFSFIGGGNKNTAPTTTTATNNFPTQQQPSQTKQNAFNFIKGGNTPQSQAQSQSQPQQQTSQNKYDAFLDLDLSSNANNTQGPSGFGNSGSNFMDLYSNKTNQPQQNNAYAGLGNIDFSGSTQHTQHTQQPGGFNYGGYNYGQQPQQMYHQPQQMYQHPQHSQPQQSYNNNPYSGGSFGQNALGNLDLLGENYQGMTNPNAYMGSLNPDSEKTKKQQEQEEKFFDFVQI